MSVATAKAARAAMKEKAQRMAKKPARVKTKIDMGSMEAAEQGATTKAQKAYRTARKDGGKVHGKAAPKRADKVQRVKKDGGGSAITNEPVGAAFGRWWRGRNVAPEISAGGSGAVPGAYGMAQPLTDMQTYDVPTTPVSTTAGERRQYREGSNDRIADSARRAAVEAPTVIPSRPESRSYTPAPAARPAPRPAAPAARQPTADELMDYYNIGGGRVSNEMAQLAAMRNRPEDAGPMKRGGAAKKKSAKKTAKGR